MSIFDRLEAVKVCCVCGKRLDREYYYKCAKCEEVYCFTHRDKHIQDCSFVPVWSRTEKEGK